VLVLVLGMGVLGSIIATVAAQAVSVTVLSIICLPAAVCCA
jgi:Na+-driven multidrug efflux pump